MQNNERQRSVHSPQNSTQRHITQLFGGVAAGREKLNYSIIQFSVRLPRCLVKFIIMTNIIFVRAARELIMLQFSTKFNFRSATDTIWLRTFDLHSMAMCKTKTAKKKTKKIFFEFVQFKIQISILYLIESILQ